MTRISFITIICFSLLSACGVIVGNRGRIRNEAEIQSVAIDNPDKSLSPYFMVNSDNPGEDRMPLKSTSAEVQIAGVIANVKVKQVYVNEGKNTLEAIYVFPGSTRAAVYGMTMTIGERKLVAKIEEKEKARQVYETAKTQGKTASLLEQQRPNVFQMNVANILPKDSITVELYYTELLIPVETIYEFVFPTVVGPRYSEKIQTTPSENWVKNPYQEEGEDPTYDFDIEASIHAGLPIQEVACVSHKASIDFINKNTVKIELEKTELKRGNKDFILRYRLSGGQIESGVLLYENDQLTASADEIIATSEEKFFILMMQPPKAPTLDQIPPREYVFIVDVSGSMRGFAIEVSKTVLKNLISKLRPSDKFNVMLFESNNQMLYPTSVDANATNIQKACTVMDQYYGAGGTQLLPALQNAFAMTGTEDYARTFVVVTDGYITVEKEAFDIIRQNLNKANLFAFGIGSSVNRFLIEGMASAGMGEPFVVTNEQEAATVGERFRKFIETPVLTRIQVSYNGFDTYDVEPVSVPDVFAERPIIVYGKYRGEAKGTITVSGISGNNEYKETIELSRADKSNNQAIKYLWARNKIKWLSDYDILTNTFSSKEEITKLGLQYNLLTDYTSFIATDFEIRNREGKQKTIQQVLPLPQGVTSNAVSKQNQQAKYYQRVTGSVERSSNVGNVISIDFFLSNSTYKVFNTKNVALLWYPVDGEDEYVITFTDIFDNIVMRKEVKDTIFNFDLDLFEERTAYCTICVKGKPDATSEKLAVQQITNKGSMYDKIDTAFNEFKKNNSLSENDAQSKISEAVFFQSKTLFADAIRAYLEAITLSKNEEERNLMVFLYNKFISVDLPNLIIEGKKK